MKYALKNYPALRKTVEAMRVEELLLAVICPDMAPGRAITRRTGSVFIHPMTYEAALDTARQINENRETPALIVSDMECCAGNAIEGAVMLPSMRALAEAGDERLAYQMGRFAALEGINAGYRWTFGPCVDILMNPLTPVLGLRTSGEDADTVIRYGGAFMEGLQDAGMAATIKHFPGDGTVPDDQHLTVPVNELSREEWDATFGRVYRELIERGAMAIMPGHIALPAYDEVDENGVYPPATVSKNLLTGLLKERLGFEGIIVSDATIMGGFCGYRNFYRACAAFLEAGGDCLLFVQDNEEYLTEMGKLVEAGELTVATLRERAYRMLCFAKENFERIPADMKLPFDREAAEACAREVARKAVKLTRDRVGLLPLKTGKKPKIAHAVLYPVWITNHTCADDLNKALSARAEVDTFADPGGMDLVRLAKSGEYDCIVCSVIEEASYGTNTWRLVGPAARNMMCGWMRYGTPAVFVCHANPYFGDSYNAVADTVINCYGHVAETANAVTDIIFGE